MVSARLLSGGAQTFDAIFEAVRNARDQLGVTVIWVEHVMQAVMSLAERIVVLNFGSLLADGPPAVVMRDPHVVEAYLGTKEVRRAGDP